MSETQSLHPLIKVLQPKLPSAEQLLPYLRRIDATRIYSNYGPLSEEFTHRLGTMVGGSPTTLCSNGTTAIELALKLRAKLPAGLCLMPAFTFVASAHAVCNAGLTPYLVEVDPFSLALTPAIAEQALKDIDQPVAAVLVVSAFGAPPDFSAWEVFERQHGIPVVFDAAAAVTSLSRIGTQPVCVSLHATKVLGIGEGGAMFAGDAELAQRARAMTGFGFAGVERSSSLRGGNYRISEYAAAIGLAVLDDLPDRVQVLRSLTARYAERLKDKAARLQDGVGSQWVTMTLNALVPSGDVEEVIRRLDSSNIQWRHWWGLGCHRHPAFMNLPCAHLGGTDALAPTVLGLPFHAGLSDDDLDRVAACLP